MRGKQCPMPVIEAKRMLDNEIAGEVIAVRVDNEIAVENLKKLAASRGAVSKAKKLQNDDFVVEIDGGGTKIDPVGEVKGKSVTGTVIVVASDRMGEPEEELGKILMKGFIYAVSRLDELPSAVLFYNGGARLTTEDSDSLEDLKEMEAQGVEILTCGTCLKYLGLEDRLKVGSVSNMYDIVDRMASAETVIRP